MDKKNKQQYKLKNGLNYNQALINRGSLTIWFGESLVEHWHHPEKWDIDGIR